MSLSHFVHAAFNRGGVKQKNYGIRFFGPKIIEYLTIRLIWARSKCRLNYRCGQV